MTEEELRHVAFALGQAFARPDEGGEAMIRGLHQFLALADAALREQGIELSYRRRPPADFWPTD